LLLHNLADEKVTVDIGPLSGMNGDPYDLFVDGTYAAPTKKLSDLMLNGWGYRWIRLSRSDKG
jgi:maltose alpha-D-glucosyltransferase/alpha-amylase